LTSRATAPRTTRTPPDHAIGEGEEPGALRIVDAAPSATARALMIVGAVAAIAVAIAIVWIFVAGS